MSGVKVTVCPAPKKALALFRNALSTHSIFREGEEHIVGPPMHVSRVLSQVVGSHCERKSLLEHTVSKIRTGFAVGLLCCK
jgi:hypothetical protein